MLKMMRKYEICILLMNTRLGLWVITQPSPKNHVEL